MGMIDGDPQCNLTSFFVPREEKEEEEKKEEEEEEVSSYDSIRLHRIFIRLHTTSSMTTGTGARLPRSEDRVKRHSLSLAGDGHAMEDGIVSSLYTLSMRNQCLPVFTLTY